MNRSKYRGCFKDGKQEGVWTTWYENGIKKSEITYRDGTLNGPFLTWKKDGSKDQQGQYTNGKSTGIWTTFNYLKGYDSKWNYDTDTRVE